MKIKLQGFPCNAYRDFHVKGLYRVFHVTLFIFVFTHYRDCRLQGIPFICTCKLQGRIGTQGFPVHVTGKTLTVRTLLLCNCSTTQRVHIIKQGVNDHVFHMDIYLTKYHDNNAHSRSQVMRIQAKRSSTIAYVRASFYSNN